MYIAFPLETRYSIPESEWKNHTHTKEKSIESVVVFHLSRFYYIFPKHHFVHTYHIYVYEEGIHACKHTFTHSISAHEVIYTFKWIMCFN